MLQEATAISQASGYGGATRLPSAEGEHQEWEFAQMGAYAFLIETHTQFQPPYDSALAEAAMVWPGILSVIERPISISGHVTDAVTGAALEARIELLNVTFPNGETNSSGGRYGRYHMFLPPGTYDVRFSKAGYVSVVRTVSVTSSSASVMDIRLAPPDTTPPDTTLTATPPAVTNSASASFTFAATEAGSTFQCALDGGGFAPCASPQTYSALASGNHTFQVRATDPAGNTDPTPASFTWTVDTVAPDTIITATPPAVTNSASASFTFAATEAGSTFQCALDGGGFAPCASPQTYSALASGNHTFQVRATDPAGNTDPTPASFTWTVDTAAPVRSGGQPLGTLPAGTTQTTLALTTNSDARRRGNPSAGGPYDAMTQTFATTGGMAHSTPVSGLVDGGSYAFYVRCLDTAANATPDDFAISFTVDLPADTAPPVRSGGQPLGTLPAGTTQTTLALTTNEAATCRYSPSAGVPYDAMTQTFATTGGTAHSTPVSGLVDGSSYAFYLSSLHMTANANPDDFAISFTVDTPATSDTPMPSRPGGQPTGPLPAGTTQTTLALTTTDAATCRYLPDARPIYDAMTQTFATTGGTAHSAPVSGLVDGGSYAFYVRCLDAAANANPDDFAISFTVAARVGVSWVFSDDLETDHGWTRNPNGTDPATTGLWERGDPQAVSYNGPKQLGTTVSGVNALVTGRLAGSSAGTHDIDGGVTSIRSPVIALPSTGDLTLSFSYYFAHASNSSSADFLRVRIVGGTTTTVFEQRGAATDRNAVWGTASVSLNSFAGQIISILIEAADAGSPSLVEAAIDDVTITQR